MDHIDKIELSSTIRQVTYRSKAVLAPLFAPVCHAPHFIGSNLKIVRVSRALNQSGASQKASFRSSEMRSRCAARCGPLWHRTSTLRKLRSWFWCFSSKKPKLGCAQRLFETPKEMLPTKSSSPHSLRKWWEIYWATPCADCTIDTKNHLDRIHLKSWLSFVASSHAFPKQHENMMRYKTSISSISSIHIIQIIH